MLHAIEKCIENGFFIKIRPVSGGFTVEYPPNNFHEPQVPPLVITYIVNFDKGGLDIYRGDEVKTYELNKRILRPAIAGLILTEAKKRNIGYNLILIVNNDKYYEFKDFIQMLPLELHEEDFLKEQDLFVSVPAIVYGDVSKVESNEDSTILCDLLQGEV